ncbi:cytochrome p450 [Hirsutella rhossiliensis]|uniref:Cytochrome p450 domain-containing protein n=1 Tax=Hirsutella rhossiliensis TaxID=111463 RepID=A0A9P8MWS5_9HYPO|nr:cytochrome p450 domain-containing protein [Hirsutella rhossiliensis]KAH0960597.1 cytochrome p450 domain-containing protein [Hirsutella rhossiliensis]
MLIDGFSTTLWALVPAALISFLVHACLPRLILQWRLRHIPIANKKPGEWSDQKAIDRAQTNAKEIIKEAFVKYRERPFQLISQVGRRVILPPHLIDSVKSDNRLSSSESLRNAFSINLPGFGGLLEPTEPGNPNMFSLMVRQAMTHNLSRFTEVLVEESRTALAKEWGMDEEWHEVDALKTARKIVATLSAKVFLGDEAAHNDEWLNITIDYTVNLCLAQRQLRHFRGWSRLLVHWFLPRCIKLRQQYNRAATVIAPILKKRREQIDLAEKGLGKMPNDAVGWMHEVSKGRKYDPVGVQLGLSIVALHTSSDLLGHVLGNLCKHPEYIDRLREEALEVLGEHGWHKTSLYKLKLMDSVLNESQRVVPASMTMMGRKITEDMTLADGTFLPRGAMVAAMAHRQWDPKIYPNPLEWQGDRHVKMREEEPSRGSAKGNAAQFVSTSAEHLGFGHGSHACPGRFFASNELKLVLVEIISAYDFGCANEGGVPPPLSLATEWLANPELKLRVRRRKIPILESVEEDLVRR